MSDKIKVMLSTALVDKAPANFNWSAFYKTFKEEAVTLQELAAHIMKGYSYIPPYKNGRRIEANYTGAYHVAFDFDAEGAGLKTLDAIPLVRDFAAFLHSTPSHTAENPRSRVVFIIPEGIKSPEEHRALYTAMAAEFKAAGSITDPNCKDPLRLYYGAKGKPLLMQAKTMTRGEVKSLIALHKPIQHSIVEANGDEERIAIDTEDADVKRRFEYELDKVRNAPDGQKQMILHTTSKLFGGWVASKYLTDTEAEELLQQAIRKNGRAKSIEAAYKTIRKSLDIGKGSPVIMKQSAKTAVSNQQQPPPPDVPPPPEDEWAALDEYIAIIDAPAGELHNSFSEYAEAKHITLVESPVTAERLNGLGIKGAGAFIAIEGLSLSRQQIAILKKHPAERVYLALGMDTESQKATAAIIGQLAKIRKSEELFVVGWEDEITAEAISDSARLGEWLGYYITSDYPDTLSDTQEETLYQESIIQRLRLSERVNERKFVDIVTDKLGWRVEEWHARAEISKAEKRKQVASDNAKRMATQAAEIIAMGDTAEGASLLQKAGDALRQQEPAKLPEPYLLADALSDIINAPDGLPIYFKQLINAAIVPRAGLSIIGAKSGVGKTTLMLNLLSSWLESEKEKRFYFYSYEEPKSQIMLKLVMIWAGVVLDKDLNLKAYKQYLKEQRGTQPAIEEALLKYERLTVSGRLIIDDTAPAVEELAPALALLGDDTGAVILDYIQRISTTKKSSMRQLELAHIVQELRKTAVSTELAIVTGSQLNDEGKLREARDLYHEAALVLELDRQEINGGDEHYLKIKKQRSGMSGKKAHIFFNKPVITFVDAIGE